MTTWSDLENTLLRFEKESGVTVTLGGRILIHHLFAAILEDPHPGWQAKAESLEVHSDDLAKKLSDYLTEIWVQEKQFRRISTYQILHWVVGRLDNICPIQK